MTSVCRWKEVPEEPNRWDKSGRSEATYLILTLVSGPVSRAIRVFDIAAVDSQSFWPSSFWTRALTLHGECRN